MADEVVVAIDVGGTTMRGALARADGSLLDIVERATEADRGAEAVLEGLLDLTGDLVDRAARLELACRATGVAIPGIVDEQAGISLRAVNLGWSEVPVARLLSERVSLPVALAHDVRAAGQAEQLVGAARGCRDWVFVALGTGIAASVVVRGEPYGGARWWGGEMGHTEVDPSGPACPCGGRGHLEAIASAGALTRLHRERTGETVSAQEIVRRAGEGETVAAQLWRDAMDALARSIATYVALLDPELVVIGGGLARAGELLLAPLREEVGRQLTFRDCPSIVQSTLGADAGVIGAAVRGHALLRAAQQAPLSYRHREPRGT